MLISHIIFPFHRGWACVCSAPFLLKTKESELLIVRINFNYKPKLLPVDSNHIRILMHYIHGDKIVYRGVEFKFNSVGYDYNEWFDAKIVDLDELLATNMKIPRKFQGFPVK